MLDHQITDLDAYLDGSTWIDEHTGEIHPLTPEFFIERSKWVFARSMPANPHFYTVRDLDNNGRKSTCLSHSSLTTILNRARIEPEKLDPVFSERLLR
jgi:hypothetical protein